MNRKVFCLLALGLLLLPVSALAFTIDLYETVDNTATGIPSLMGPIVTLPDTVFSGTLFIWEGQSGDRRVLSNMLFFYADITKATGNHVQLFSDDPFRPFPDPLAGLPAGEVFEGDFSILPILFFAGPNTYHIWTDLLPGTFGNAVPLPPGALLLGSGLLGLVGWRRFRKN
ncbi:MAG: hypothetical protein WC405_20315 [Syntrophales bacterium]